MPTATINLALAYRRANKQGDSIRAVCERAGLSKETVHQLSRNRGDPKLSTLLTIAESFGLTLFQFLDLGRDEELERVEQDRLRRGLAKSDKPEQRKGT
jgi:transcriptional regulator with XRE-family HTH domain